MRDGCDGFRHWADGAFGTDRTDGPDGCSVDGHRPDGGDRLDG